MWKARIWTSSWLTSGKSMECYDPLPRRMPCPRYTSSMVRFFWFPPPSSAAIVTNQYLSTLQGAELLTRETELCKIICIFILHTRQLQAVNKLFMPNLCFQSGKGYQSWTTSIQVSMLPVGQLANSLLITFPVICTSYHYLFLKPRQKYSICSHQNIWNLFLCFNLLNVVHCIQSKLMNSFCSLENVASVTLHSDKSTMSLPYF